VMDLETARRMLPLVRRIITDLLQHGRIVAELRPEQDRLDRARRTLAWPERARRYQIREEISTAERGFQETTAELDSLGVFLLDAEMGRVGFPTMVNDHRAFFSWRPGEDALGYWHFAGETVRRAIRASWARTPEKS